MEAELTLINLTRIIDENLADFEVLEPLDILQAHTDLLLHLINF